MSGYNAPSQLSPLGISDSACAGKSPYPQASQRKQVVLPMHTGTLKVDILLDAIELAGISPEEFEELL